MSYSTFFQMWSARIALLIQLGLFHEAERELVAFEELQNPDLYYQYHTHSYPGKTGNHGYICSDCATVSAMHYLTDR